MICRHCNRSRVTRPRGLCWSCYYRPGVRDQYVSRRKGARRGVGNVCGGYDLPEPTRVLPGTPEKLAVLARRAEQGKALFHPQDAPHEMQIHEQTRWGTDAGLRNADLG